MVNSASMTVGVLALQGDFAEHIAVLRSLRVTAKEIRTAEALRTIDALIIPGGESTVMSQFLYQFGMADVIIERAKNGMPVYGTCAGAIIVAKQANGKNAPQTLGLIDIDVDRNAYGSQAQSFETQIDVKGIHKPVPVAFIRAPIIARVGPGVEILASHDGKPVLVRQGSVLAGTFHPEIRGETAIHELFLRGL